jgi:hypothetical protein
MILRQYRESDLERLKEIHRKQGFEYPMPDLSDPTFITGAVMEDGEAQSALFLRLTAEAYLFMDPTAGTPRDRWQSFLELHENARAMALKIGLQDVHAFLPPNLGTGFDRRLKKLGWGSDTWRVYSYRVR